MMFAGRRIILTTLDPIPRSFRAVPGCIALHKDEVDALNRLDGEKFKEIIDIIKAEDWADAVLTVRPKLKKRTVKLAPSVRMSMLNAAYRRAG